MAWHDSTCATLHLDWHEERPGCRTCGRRAPSFTPAQAAPPPAPPPDTKRSDLLLSFVRDHVDDWTGSSVNSGKPRIPTSTTYRVAESGNVGPTSDFIYHCLPNTETIRLLRLHGTESEIEPVHGALEIHRLHDPCMPIFEALSYTWADSTGDSTLCKAVFVGPQYHVLSVTSNCLAALRQFRTSHDRLIWVDAICINQADQIERGHQVALMRDIYSSASRVLIYEGYGNLKADKVMETLTKLEHHSPTVHESGCNVRILLEMPYFSRMWTVQEVQLAKTASLTFGNRTVHWGTFQSQIASWCQGKDEMFNRNWVKHLGLRTSKRDMISCLKSTRHCKCGDPRDRIYGLMGLVRSPEQDD
ncbi:Nn.00g103830.m01.CDS01 [Neocucurbitaria sp. VM-36]